jgi:hypothetical protein
MMNDNRTYVIFDTDEVSAIDFAEVLEDSENICEVRRPNARKRKRINN